jgi:hypothetical protein
MESIQEFSFIPNRRQEKLSWLVWSPLSGQLTNFTLNILVNDTLQLKKTKLNPSSFTLISTGENCYLFKNNTATTNDFKLYRFDIIRNQLEIFKDVSNYLVSYSNSYPTRIKLAN